MFADGTASASASPSLRYSESSRVLTEAQRLEHAADLSASRVDRQQIACKQDLEHLAAVKKVEVLRSSFSKESTSSTSNRSRPSSVLSPTTPTTSRPRSVAESTSSQRASSLADMSLQGERVISTAGQDQLDSKTDIDQIEASLTDSSSGLLVDAQSGVDANDIHNPSTSTTHLQQLSDDIDALITSLHSTATLIFEIQELRHTSIAADEHGTSQPRPSTDDSPPSESVDVALKRLEILMSSLPTAMSRVDEQIEALVIDLETAEPNQQLTQVQHDFANAKLEWTTLQRDVEILREELTEDKWLTVFRTVSLQAEDMMRSLDKIIRQCQHFVDESAERHSVVSNDSDLCASYHALQKSLQAKSKHYVPATNRVLSILGKGIADRATKNGVALRTYADLKARWQTLYKQVTQMQATMDNLDERYRADTVAESTSSTPRPAAMPTSKSAASLSDVSQGVKVAVTPPRPAKSPGRPSADVLGVSPPQTPSGVLSNRRSVSNLDGHRSPSARLSRRAVSPEPSGSTIDRPRWSYSLKPTRDRSETPGLTQPLPSPHNASGRTSALGSRRPSSRMSIGNGLSRSYHGERPVSPAFSDASSTLIRDRPSTPSKIPLPASVQRRQSTSTFSDLYDPADQHSTIMQRVMSPSSGSSQRTPLNVSRGAGSRRLSVASGLGVSQTSSARAPSPGLSASSRSRGTMTPEPRIAAQARRLSHARMLSSPTRPPPVPRVPSNYRRESMMSLAGPQAHVSIGDDHSQRPQVYVPNRLDPLDIAVAHIVNAGLPTTVRCSRADPPLTLAQAGQCETWTARYQIDIVSVDVGVGVGSSTVVIENKPVMCKLVDKVGPRTVKGDKKVLVRTGAGWQEFESFVLALLAAST